MELNEVKKMWNESAEAWTVLSRGGYDVYRDHFNTPAFLKILPEIRGFSGIDIGCGEGHNTRLLAGLGAKMTGIDISDKFISHAVQKENESRLGIKYETANATALPFPDNNFDFAVSFMCLMDTPDPDMAISEAYRVTKPGGFFQFSITHPCFNTVYTSPLRDESGKIRAFEVSNYFSKVDGKIEEWTFSSAPDELKKRYPRFKVPRFTRPLNIWLKYLLGIGFSVEAFEEPSPSDEAVRKHPSLQSAQVVALFLHLRARKPG